MSLHLVTQDKRFYPSLEMLLSIAQISHVTLYHSRSAYRDLHLNRKTFQRFMQKLGLVCSVRMKKCRSYEKQIGIIAPNLLNRDFHVEKTNQNGLRIWQSFIYLARSFICFPFLTYIAVILPSRLALMLSMVTTMLDKAFEKILDQTNLILHSDQDWQYQHG